jgi:hypothetical protein
MADLQRRAIRALVEDQADPDVLVLGTSGGNGFAIVKRARVHSAGS